MPSGINIGQQGWGQSTAAMQTLMRSGIGGARSSGAPRRKRRSKSATKRASGTRRTKRSAKSSRGAKLKKGSAAAKAWGAKMRRLRRG